MRAVYILVATLAIASAFVRRDQEWEEFKVKFNKQYTPEEDVKRHHIFIENKIKIGAHNKRYEAGQETFKIGVNQFADMLPEELKQFKGLQRNSNEGKIGSEVFKTQEGVAYPDSVDWRVSGCVGSVQDQGQCGSSSIYSAIGSIEGVCCVKQGSFVALSLENLIDCVGGGGCSGGGTVIEYFDYCVANGGIDTAESYNSTRQGGICNFDPANAQCACTGYTTITFGNEDELLAVVATVGPVPAAIDASHVSFQLYTGGIYYESACSSTVLDHSVLVVGYGTENDQDYWLVQNSWGNSWGEAGYIRMSRNMDNNCGIASAASYPLV